MGLFDKVFGSHSDKELKRISKTVDKIEALDESMQKLSDETLDIHTTDAQGWEDEISIDELTQVFFDYNAGQILKEHEYLKDIVPAGPIYISEEV